MAKITVILQTRDNCSIGIFNLTANDSCLDCESWSSRVASIFISYSSNDQVKVERLAETLRQEKGITVWLDTTNIYPGDDFLEEIKKGIRAADKIIICLSPSFNTKPPVSWVKKELKMAILREGETGKNIIIPVRIKSGGQIPEEIGTKAYADMSTKNRWNRNLPRLISAIKRLG